ncbi:MAG: M23 family metallopeptidase [Anaerolineales bacterium]
MSSGRSALRWVLSLAFVLLVVVGYLLYRGLPFLGKAAGLERFTRLRAWFNDPAAHPDWVVAAAERCGEAPFVFPTNGYIGFIWGDSFRIGHRHQGLDIFGGAPVGVTPVVAAYAGFLSRLPEWKSSLIIRIPQDPLQPDRQVWTYYTHMADAGGASYISPEFPPGTSEVYVEAGSLLGYQGNFSGDPDNPTGVHLHFSIVLDDGQGGFRNELEVRNTIDPSPYFGLPLNAEFNRGEIPVCPA